MTGSHQNRQQPPRSPSHTAANLSPNVLNTHMNNLRMSNSTSQQQQQQIDSQETALFVKNLLEQMQSKFNTMGESIIGRIDEMGSRIDDLEKNISDLMDQAGMEQPNRSGGLIMPSSNNNNNNNNDSSGGND
eukprot:CAMPEP_0178949058 /NCGR_PEP_ID=MMETSP0789-20121207/5819_1 /TAXON_ID=3005 /ORGANISM="Rhizosolenia setigera, Strain CCMP 1694" /LENGTH=131 /DNA_ID=CAMNT_0020629497 /DNA_START=54 /DNA_END=449 /DNA_ORIENTATION=-